MLKVIDCLAVKRTRFKFYFCLLTKILTRVPLRRRRNSIYVYTILYTLSTLVIVKTFTRSDRRSPRLVVLARQNCDHGSISEGMTLDTFECHVTAISEIMDDGMCCVDDCGWWSTRDSCESKCIETHYIQSLNKYHAIQQ